MNQIVEKCYFHWIANYMEEFNEDVGERDLAEFFWRVAVLIRQFSRAVEFLQFGLIISERNE